MSTSQNSIDQLFGRLWADYVSFNPHAQRIHDDILEAERSAGTKALVNDHIALRTFAVERIGLGVLAKPFLELGYKRCGEYEFPEKKLFALHFEHPEPNKPKVFISELLIENFSPKLKSVAGQVAQSISASLLGRPEMLWSGRTWAAEHRVYQELLKESEYAAWVYAFGFRCNHFTVLFNELKSFKSLETLNQFLTEKGHRLNASGGLIKGTPAQLLEQSSTMAGEVDIEFTDGRHRVPACYYEFARRYPLPGKSQLYQGFIAASADKIFESTNRQA